MYLAGYAIEQQSWVQAIVRLDRYPAGSEPGEWHNTLRNLIRLSESLPNCFSAFRVSLSNDRLLTPALIFVVPREAEKELQRIMASFTRLDTYLPDSISIPQTRESHDEMVEAVPAYQCHIPTSCYSTDNIWFACDFRVAGFLDDLVSQAELSRHALTYQANFSRFEASTDVLREARKNYLNILNLRGVNNALAELQKTLVDRLLKCAHVCEEFLAVSEVDAIEWAQKLLSREFEKRYSTYKFEAPVFEFVQRSHAESFSTGIHRSAYDLLGADEICSSAVNDEEKHTILMSWRSMAMGKSAKNDQTELLLHPRARQSSDDTTYPRSHNDSEGYIFVSYSHEDLTQVSHVLEYVDSQGYKFWYDKGIPGGAEWDELIETKIARCQFLLVFVSSSSINSKYVRREVKFADLMNKIVLAVMLEDAELHTGMKMLLTQYQCLRVASPEFSRQLLESLKILF